MTSVHSSPTTASSFTPAVSVSLEAEASELEALNAGLKRHVIAWRTAHESAVGELTSLLARMDAVIARAERNLR